MTEVGLGKLEQPDFTASARAGTPSLVVIAEEAIPQVYWLPQPPKLDRQASLTSSSGAPSYPALNSATRNRCSW